MIRTPKQFADIARVGPIAHQGRTIHSFVSDRRLTGVIAVALPEEMPVNETLLLRDELADAGLGIDRVIANGCYPQRFSARDVERAARAPRQRPRPAGPLGPAGGAVRAGRAPASSASSSRACATAFGEAPVRLPFLFAPELDRDAPRRALADAGGRGCERRRACSPASASCICGGSGGVGKTTTSAAIAMGAAAAGRKVAVVTIDPAKRLANSLGLEELGNEPRSSTPSLFAAAGVEMEGELWAMMLDPKRTFDELIDRLAPDAKARDEVLDNRIYQELSNAVAGSQEFTAMAKLYELDRDHDFDLIVLDTPPSRNALDFLDAPDRLTQFLEGRALQVFLRPTGLAARVMGRGTGHGVRRAQAGDRRSTCSQDLVGLLPLALGGMIDGFKERAQAGQQAAGRPRHGVPARHVAGARADRRGDLLLAQAQGRAHALRRRGRQPRPPRPARRRRGRRRQRRARPPSWATSSRAAWPRTSATTTCSPARDAAQHRAPRPAAARRPSPARPPPRRGRPRHRGPRAPRPLPVRDRGAARASCSTRSSPRTRARRS